LYNYPKGEEEKGILTSPFEAERAQKCTKCVTGHNKFTLIWPVVPLCKNQLRDIKEEDILEKGLYRLCNTYKGGGGYDQFNKIYEKRFKTKISPTQLLLKN
jgi:hypothetical protein